MKNGSETAAQYVARLGHKELAAFIDPWPPAYRSGEVIDAAGKGTVAQLEECLRQGAIVDEQDARGYTPLLCAACYGRKAAAEFLIARKANVNHTCKEGQFALF